MEPPRAEEPAWGGLVDLWLGLIAGLVLAGPGVTLTLMPVLMPGVLGGFAALVVIAGVVLLLALPLGVAWASRRPDWQAAGLRAVAVGLVAAAVAAPLMAATASLAGVAGTTSPWLLATTAAVGAAVSAAPVRTGAWSLPARAAAVVVVLVAPLAVLVAGEALGPQPVAVAQSMWTAAPLGVIPVVGLADTAAAGLEGRSSARRDRGL